MAVTQLGRLLMTRGVADVIENKKEFAAFVWECVEKFLKQDWGSICDEDWKRNDSAFLDPIEHGRILASYEYLNDESLRIWIIRESDLSVTTILFPHEY
jgi:hypothetical protein